jgi:hypothetical protein
MRNNQRFIYWTTSYCCCVFGGLVFLMGLAAMPGLTTISPATYVAIGAALVVLLGFVFAFFASRT